MKWYPYGHDFGNADIGGVTVVSGNVFSRSIPTAFTKVDTTAMHNLGISVDDADTHIIRFHDEAMAYAVGELALQQSTDIYNGRGDIQRYDFDNPALIFITDDGNVRTLLPTLFPGQRPTRFTDSSTTSTVGDLPMESCGTACSAVFPVCIHSLNYRA